MYHHDFDLMYHARFYAEIKKEICSDPAFENVVERWNWREGEAEEDAKPAD